MYDDDVWFGVNSNFPPFISLLHALVFALPMKKNTLALELLFFLDSVHVLIVLFGKIMLI